MRFGLTDQQFAFIDQKVVRPLAAKGAAVFCFGSRARGDHQPFSDLDLMVESSSKTDLNLEAIAEELSSSNFPLKVDLVHILDFADSYKDSYLAERTPF